MLERIGKFLDDLDFTLGGNLNDIVIGICIIVVVIVVIVLIVKYVKYQKSLYKPPPPPTTTQPQTTQPPTFIKSLETNTKLQYIVIGSSVALFIIIAVIVYFATASKRAGNHKIRRPDRAHRSYSHYK